MSESARPHALPLDDGALAAPRTDVVRRAPHGAYERLLSLDAARVVLSLAVLAYHLSGTIALAKYFDVHAFATLFAIGDARIPFFFTLSGFLLTRLHRGDVGRPERLLPFLRRRAVRILPLYWLVLLLVAAVALVVPGWAGKVPLDPWVVVKALALVPQDPSVAGPTGAPLLIAAWTLQYEIAFYLVLAAFIVNRALGAGLLVGLVANAWWCSGHACGIYASFLASEYALHFAIGAVAALVAGRVPPFARAWRVARFAIVAYVALAVMQYLGPSTDAVDWNLWFSLVAGAVLLGLTAAERTAPATQWRKPLRLLSDSSYALYLIHFPAISAGCKLLTSLGLSGPVGATIAFVAIFAGCVVASIGVHLYVEKPLVERLR